MTSATSIKIDEQLKQRVQQIAATRQRSAHWLMREAIREYVEREEKREALRKSF
jgi:predicted transcriptional regulator